MKRIALLIWLRILCATGFSQSLPFDDSIAIHFRPTNLVIRWTAPDHPWPKMLGTYRVVPTDYSPAILSNLMGLGPFTEADKQDSGTNVITFSRSGRVLHACPTEGQIVYSSPSRTDLAKNVPETNDLVRLATNFLRKIGISSSEIAKRRNGCFEISFPGDDESYTFFRPPDHTIISNIQSRTVVVRRALEGVLCAPQVGRASLMFGERGRVEGVSLEWRNVKCDKLYAAARPERIMQWIRQGRAIQKRMVDWRTGQERIIRWHVVKSLTITNATACYWGDLFFERERAHQPLLPSWVVPYAELSGTVDTGMTNIDVQIVCPVIDDTLPVR